jgi:HAD superfamily hydrolase (TIGR01662 family)
LQASRDQTVQLIMGPPASGKTTLAKRLCGATPGIVRLSRDDTGGALRELVPRVRKALQRGQSVVLDNLFATAAERRPFIEESRKRDVAIMCTVVDLDIEQCMINACRRIIQSSGRLLAPDEIERSRDASVIPPVVLFHYRKRFEPPSEREGFDSIEHIAGHRPEFTGTGKALFVDYDGTLRETINGGKYPVDTSQVRVLPGRTAVLKAYQAMGYRILGVSNQSGIEGGTLTAEQATACFDETHRQLGMTIEYLCCPHRVPPIGCYCRKPQPGMAVAFIERYSLKPWSCIMVGDLGTDRTFAERLGMRFVPASEFFRTGLA